MRPSCDLKWPLLSFAPLVPSAASSSSFKWHWQSSRWWAVRHGKELQKNVFYFVFLSQAALLSTCVLMYGGSNIFILTLYCCKWKKICNTIIKYSTLHSDSVSQSSLFLHMSELPVSQLFDEKISVLEKDLHYKKWWFSIGCELVVFFNHFLNCVLVISQNRQSGSREW